MFRDNIYVGTATHEEHKSLLRTLFQKLREVEFKIGSGTIGRARIPLLGFTVGNEGLKPAAKNLENIRNMGIPTKPREIRKLLGTTGFYRMLIPDYTKIVAPLEEMLVKGKMWNQEQVEAAVVNSQKIEVLKVVSTENQIADIFTKSLEYGRFVLLRDKL